MQLDRRGQLGPICGTLMVGAVIGAGALHASFGQRPAGAAEGGVVTPVFAYELPHLPEQQLTGVLVEYAPGGSSPPHHHTAEGWVVAYVLEGAIRSKVNDGRSRSTRRARAGSSRRARPIRSARTQARPSRRGCSRCSSRRPAPS